MFRSRRIVDDSSDDDFPNITDLLKTNSKRAQKVGDIIGTPAHTKESSAKNGTVRRRKLGAVVLDNPLMRPLSGQRSSSSSTLFDEVDETPRKRVPTTLSRIELMKRKTNPVVKGLERDESDSSEMDSVQEETILENFSEGSDDDNGNDDESDFEAIQSEDSDDDSLAEFLSWSPSKSKRAAGRTSAERDETQGRKTKRSPSPGAQLLAEAIEAQEREQKQTIPKGGKINNEATRGSSNANSDLADPLFKLRIQELPPPSKCRVPSDGILRPGTSPSPPVQSKPKGLISPSKKISRIPATPHHPQMDTFWDQEFIDEWNDEHSPKKKLFEPLTKSQSNSFNKKMESSSPKKSRTSEAAAAKAAKKAFAQAKHEVAEKFLRELDERITDNKLSKLAESTGGIRIEWSKTLNTTAGRANWRRVTTKSKTKEDAGSDNTKTYHHHASIELAEKVINDEHRLLNVIAHEFCHLANFMITGITNNPHGKEFKAWAAKVTRVFGQSRGIEVTTKHSYDIDFKYVWECTDCAIEYKRHSKSIHPERHRCGACKGLLKQTKPTPRGGTGEGKGEDGKEVPAKKESEYQRFMKEQMRILKAENPGCLQKDIMRMVATRWAAEKDQRGKKPATSLGAIATKEGSEHSTNLDGVAKGMDKLAIIDLT